VEQVTLMLKPREASLVLRGLVRRLGRSEKTRELAVRINSNTITLQHALDSRRSFGAKKDSCSADTHLGASLIGGLATAMNWSINESQVASGQITITLPISDD
jgi:hypothetical protein